MFIQVLPTAHSLSDEPLTYIVPEGWQDQIVIGGYVEVPLGKHLVTGIIAEVLLDAPSDIEMRPLHMVLSSTPLLAPYQLRLVGEIARHWRMPIHRVLGLFLPKSLLTRLEKDSFVLTPILSGAPRERKFTHLKDRHVLGVDFLKELIPGTVVIVPDDVFLRVFEADHGESFPPGCEIFSQSATPARRQRLWRVMTEGKCQILVGTRRLLYYNLSAFSRVLYLEDSFGRELYNYPNTLDALELLRLFSLHFPTSLHIITAHPALPTLQLIRSQQYAGVPYASTPRTHPQ